jgi:hypothetical protein
MTPYETEQVVVVTNAAVEAAINFPGRCLLNRVAAVKIDSSGVADFTVYNRNFLSATLNITAVINNGGYCAFIVYGFLPVRVGDSLTVAGTTLYDGVGAHRVTAIAEKTLDPTTYETPTNNNNVSNAPGTPLYWKNDTAGYAEQATRNYRLITTNVAFTSAVHTGTVTLYVPPAEQALYMVAQTSSGNNPFAEVLPNTPFVNQDVQPNANIGYNRKLYILFTVTGTFKVTARASEGISTG